MDLNNVSPSLCVKGCGFYGSHENKNMCSKCYADFLKFEIIANSLKSLSIEEEVSKPHEQLLAESSDRSDLASTAIDGVSAKGGSGKKMVNRCKSCNKKVGLTGFKCRCGELFCGTHRYPKEHSCTFDFKKFDRDVLIKRNPLIMAEKLSGKI